jgi:hypothetical protein
VSRGRQLVRVTGPDQSPARSTTAQGGQNPRVRVGDQNRVPLVGLQLEDEPPLAHPEPVGGTQTDLDRPLVGPRDGAETDRVELVGIVVPGDEADPAAVRVQVQPERPPALQGKGGRETRGEDRGRGTRAAPQLPVELLREVADQKRIVVDGV